jgi:RNA polymerase sigma-70 factor (ECF subfamily)
MPTFSQNSVLNIFSTAADKLSSVAVASTLEQDLLAMYDELRRPLLRYALIFGLKVEDAEDVVQQTFIALFQHLQDNRSRENLRSWVFRVTHNLALKRRMQQKNEVLLEGKDGVQESFFDPSPSPEATLLFNERQERLRRVVHALPKNDQACLQLRAEGLRYREISSILGISLGSVSNSLATSLEKLTRSDRR